MSHSMRLRLRNITLTVEQKALLIESHHDLSKSRIPLDFSP